MNWGTERKLPKKKKKTGGMLLKSTLDDQLLCDG